MESREPTLIYYIHDRVDFSNRYTLPPIPVNKTINRLMSTGVADVLTSAIGEHETVFVTLTNYPRCDTFFLLNQRNILWTRSASFYTSLREVGVKRSGSETRLPHSGGWR